MKLVFIHNKEDNLYLGVIDNEKKRIYKHILSKDTYIDCVKKIQLLKTIEYLHNKPFEDNDLLEELCHDIECIHKIYQSS